MNNNIVNDHGGTPEKYHVTQAPKKSITTQELDRSNDILTNML